MKDKLVLILKKAGLVWNETRSKVIDSQIFYFHFNSKPFCSKVVYLS